MICPTLKIPSLSLSDLFQLVSFESIILCVCSSLVSHRHAPDGENTVDVVPDPGIVLCPAWGQIFIKKSGKETGNWVLV